MWFESKPSEEMLKRKPIRPKTGRSKANPEVQKKLKMQRSRSVETEPGRSHHGQPVVFTTARGGGCTTVRSPCPQFSIFLRGFSTSCATFRFLLMLCLKRGVYLALLRGKIHSKTLFHSQKLHEEVEGRRRGIKQKATYWRRIERSTSKHCISFLFSCSSFNFSILVRISEFCLVS